jgi:hypothetical protein
VRAPLNLPIKGKFIKKKEKNKEAKSCTHQHTNKINLKRTNVISAKEFEEIKLEDFHQS